MTEVQVEADNYKLCPLIMTGWAAAPHPLIESCVTCRGPRCAWWDDARQQCAALTLARSAVKLASKK